MSANSFFGRITMDENGPHDITTPAYDASRPGFLVQLGATLGALSSNTIAFYDVAVSNAAANPGDMNLIQQVQEASMALQAMYNLQAKVPKMASDANQQTFQNF